MRRVFCYTDFVRKQKSIVIIDGSNFYHKLKELRLSNLSTFDYSQFASKISENTQLSQKYFCIGKIKAKQENVKARKMMAKQQSLVTRLQKDGFIIQFGFLLQSAGKYHEKGVDVQISVDILKGIYKHTYKTAYLVSSDSDLVPAIVEAQSFGKTVVYVGFRHKPSLALLRDCKKSILLKEEDLSPFIKS